LVESSSAGLGLSIFRVLGDGSKLQGERQLVVAFGENLRLLLIELLLILEGRAKILNRRLVSVNLSAFL
jgi:hypothetical protein